ncbi:MAG TPA: MFS transporter [Firmicutes bacterium]|jgi:fucose permease|nr:MFS transporter [Bacillota bacterium]
MATFFLIIIYLAFISLGLPDSLLGAAWPVMQINLKAPLAAAGFVSMTIAAGTILSSLASGIVIKRLGTGKVTFISCFMTAGTLLGFSLAPSLFWMIVLAVPLGLGAGSVDAALNNYVASHYQAHHMSWLHCFWGVGATIGPIIMARFIAGQNAWRGGYLTISIIQFSLTLLLFFTLPLWKRAENGANCRAASNQVPDIEKDLSPETEKAPKLLQLKGVKPALMAFLFYCGTESTLGLWGGSFLVTIKGLPAATAAEWVSLYYAGITVGRLIAGFVTMKLSNVTLIRMGQIIALAGAVLLLLPLPTFCALGGFILAGLGCAPIYPCMLHETPWRFGSANSQTVMGYQMAVAYTGSTFLPPLLGWIASRATMLILPFFLAAYIIVMLIGSEKVNAFMRAKNQISREKIN